MKHKTCISVSDRSGNKTEVLRSRRVGLPVMKLNEISLLMPIKAKPYEHQIKAFCLVCGLFGIFNALFYSRGAALLMEMGCGKTITAIAITGCLYQFEKVNRVLVVAHLGIHGVWEEEFERFSAFPYSLTVLKGSMAKKEQLEEISNKGLQIVVVNYESAWRLEKELKNSDVDLIIVDEGHKIKSDQTATGKCMRVLGDRARYKLFLTPVGRLIGKYAVPCIISLLMGALYNIVDQIFIANADYLGFYGNAANMVVLPLTVIALAIAVMISDGCCAFVSLSLWKNNPQETGKSMGNAILLMVLSGIVLCAIYLVFGCRLFFSRLFCRCIKSKTMLGDVYRNGRI